MVKFSLTYITSVQRCLNPLLQNQCIPFFCCPLFFQEHLTSSPGSTKWQTKIVLTTKVRPSFFFWRKRGWKEFMMFRLLENTFASQKLNLDIFTLAPRQNSPRCLSSPLDKGKSLIFRESVPPVEKEGTQLCH